MDVSISPRVRVIAAASIVLAVAVGSSFALYSDSGTVRSTFTSGTLDLRFDDDQQGTPTPYVVTFDGADALAPGVAVTRDLVVYNSGSVAATLALDTPVVVNAAPGPELLQNELNLTITEATAGTLYDGPLSAGSFTGLDLGADGTTATGLTLTVTVTMDSAATVAVAGQSAQIDFPFTATQAP